jgi:hypothetical protein
MDSPVFGENLWDYAIVYRETTTSESIRYRCKRGGITVEVIWPATKLLGVLNRTDYFDP